MGSIPLLSSHDTSGNCQSICLKTCSFGLVKQYIYIWYSLLFHIHHAYHARSSQYMVKLKSNTVTPTLDGSNPPPPWMIEHLWTGAGFLPPTVFDRFPPKTIWLVVSTNLKNKYTVYSLSQLGLLLPIGGNIEHVPSHQPSMCQASGETLPRPPNGWHAASGYGIAPLWWDLLRLDRIKAASGSPSFTAGGTNLLSGQRLTMENFMARFTISITILNSYA